MNENGGVYKGNMNENGGVYKGKKIMLETNNDQCLDLEGRRE